MLTNIFNASQTQATAPLSWAATLNFLLKNIHPKYNIGPKIGAGGMAEVYDGELLGDLGFKRRVAIKKMAPQTDGEDEHFNLFFNEANLASKLDHPNIVKITDFFKDASHQFYIVMEYIDGVDLRTLCESSQFTIGESLLVVKSILKALHYAHIGDSINSRPKLIHRDISPHNIMLSRGGVIKLLDFGLAKAVQNTLTDHTGVIRGKVSYMSPEQAKAQPLDARSDLFSLGVVFYELLTGERCFNGQSDAATLSQMLTTRIASPSQYNPNVSKELDHFVLSFLKRDRLERIESAEKALLQIDVFLSTEPNQPLDYEALKTRGNQWSPPISSSQETTLPKTSTSTKTLTHSQNLSIRPSKLAQDTSTASAKSKRTPKKWLLLALMPICAALVASAFLTLGESKPAIDVSSEQPTTKTSPPNKKDAPSAPPKKRKIQPIRVDAVAPKPTERTKNSGTLSFKAKPWAKIYVNKKYIGQTPQLKVKIKGNPVVVEFVNEEYGKRIKEKVFLAPGKHKLLFKNMTR